MPISIDTSNSSGVCSVAPPNDFFKSVIARWVIPHVRGTLLAPLYSWIGLAQGPLHEIHVPARFGAPIHTILVDGGIDADIMVQIGVQCVCNDVENKDIVNCTAYYQIIPFPQGPNACDGYMQIDNFSIAFGDSITAAVCNNPAQAEVWFILINETTNAIIEATIPYSSIPNIQNFQPNWAGWMVSNYISSTLPSDLDFFPYYGAVVFDGINAVTNGGAIAPPSLTLNLINPANNTLSRGIIEGTVVVCEHD